MTSYESEKKVSRLKLPLLEETYNRRVVILVFLHTADAIHGTRVNKQEHKEVLSLLKDMKTKYKMLHKKSIEQLASVESDRNTDLHEAPPNSI